MKPPQSVQERNHRHRQSANREPQEVAQAEGLGAELRRDITGDHRVVDDDLSVDRRRHDDHAEEHWQAERRRREREAERLQRRKCRKELRQFDPVDEPPHGELRDRAEEEDRRGDHADRFERDGYAETLVHDLRQCDRHHVESDAAGDDGNEVERRDGDRMGDR